MQLDRKFYLQCSRTRRAAALPLLALLFFLLIHFTIIANAAASDAGLRIRYADNRIDISVKNIELKRVLVKLAEAANFYIEFPVSLEKKVSIEKKKISLQETLDRILKDYNHVVLYSGPNSAEASVAKVFVYSKAEKSRRLTANQRRLANRIKRYERQIDAVERRLARVDQSSSRGRRYQRQIKSLKKRIERLRR